MFPAYSGRDQKEDSRRPSSPPANELHSKTRWAIQNTAKTKSERTTAAIAKEKEDSVALQVGYGMSDSDDDFGGGVRMTDPTVRSEDVSMVPSRSRDRNRADQRVERQQQPNEYMTFPAVAAAINPYNMQSSSSTSGLKKPKQEEISESSSDDGHSRKSSSRRDKSRKKKRKRARSRSRDSYRRRSPAPKKANTTRQKYEFITDNEYQAVKQDKLASNFFIRDTYFDHENASLGCNKKEITTIYLGTKFINGLEWRSDAFQKHYGTEVASKGSRNNKSFYEKLAHTAKIVPSETFFRRAESNVAGRWKVAKHKDILNKNHDDPEHIYVDDEDLSEIQKYKERMRAHKNDVEAVLKYVELKDEREALNIGKYQNNDLSGLYERHLAIVRNAIQNNRRSVDLQLKEIEYLIKLDKVPADIIARYKDLSHKFPHEPMVWMQMLDFIQFNSSAYSYDAMLRAFRECLGKLQALNDGTLLSHVSMIADFPAFRKFHLYVYVRFLKWQIACGDVPLAISNVQATFEMNFGFGLVNQLKFHDILPRVRDFWKTALPRIGDEGALGGAVMEFEHKAKDKKEIQDLEAVSFETLISRTVLAKNQELMQFRNLEVSWVHFERTMLEVDARPKRTNLGDCRTLTSEAEEELLGLQLWEPINFDDLLPFFDAHSTGVPEMAQPLLEMLGIVFSVSTNRFSLTEHVIEDWRRHGLINLDHRQNIEAVPTYSEKTLLETGRNILYYLINKRGSGLPVKSELMDEGLLKFLIALILTETSQFEKDEKFLFYQLRLKDLKTFFDLISETQDAPYKTVLAEHQHILPVLRCVLGEKFVSWWELAVKQQEEISENENAALSENHILTENDRKAVAAIQKKVFMFTDQIAPKVEEGKTSFLKNKEETLASFQLHLYANILRARLCFQNNEILRTILATEILEKSVPYVQEVMKKEGFAELMRKSMQEIVDRVFEKEEQDESSAVSELPRAGALAESLQILLDFALLGIISSKRQFLEDNVQRALKKCEMFKKLQGNWSRREDEKEKDQRDTQFVLDTIIGLLSQKNPDVGFMEFYKKIVAKATEVFPSESKYAKLFTALYTGSTIKTIELGQIITRRNEELLKLRTQRFDGDVERKLLMNSLSTTFSAMQISGRAVGGNDRMMYNKYRQEAQTSRDPAFWRLALKTAGRIDKEKLLQNDAYIRAQGQCSWSLNVHIDFIDGMSPIDNTEEVKPSLLAKTMAHLSNKDGDKKQHQIFVDDCDFLFAYYEICGTK